MNAVWNWLVVKWNWPGAAAFCGVCLLALAPFVWAIAEPPIFWIYLQLPVYLLHQLEEHAGDRFRIFMNREIGHGVEVLSRPATFVINSIGVWGVDLLALYLAIFVSPGWGLAALYLPLVNAIGHLGQAAAQRKYNPGLATATLAFIPLAGFGLWFVTRSVDATWIMQGVGLAIAIAIHAAIIAHVKRRLGGAHFVAVDVRRP